MQQLLSAELSRLTDAIGERVEHAEQHVNHGERDVRAGEAYSLWVVSYIGRGK